MKKKPPAKKPAPSSLRTQGSALSTSSPPTHLALFRAINVGGNNMLPMADLARLFQKAGCENVRTYIQSGNVLFTLKPRATADKARAAVAAAVEKQFGFRPTIIIRTRDELCAAAARHPFDSSKADHKLLHVGFLDTAPAKGAALDPQRSPHDRFELRARELYVDYAAGVHTSKLTNAYIDKTLSTVCTFRNWKTVQTLMGMMK